MGKEYFFEIIEELTVKDFTAISTCKFKEQSKLILNYVLNNMDKFNNHEEFAWDEFEETQFFYWDISTDPVIPYLLGSNPKSFKEKITSSEHRYISITLERYIQDEFWWLNLFGTPLMDRTKALYENSEKMKQYQDIQAFFETGNHETLWNLPNNM